MSEQSRVGSREHDWLYGGPDCWQSRPYQFKPAKGVPPAVLRRLIEKGLMWAERRERRRWMPRAVRWGDPQPSPEFWCGLTDTGRELIEARRHGGKAL